MQVREENEKGKWTFRVDRKWYWIIEHTVRWELNLHQLFLQDRHQTVALIAEVCLFSAQPAYKVREAKPESEFSVLEVETVHMNHKSNAGTFTTSHTTPA